MTSVLEKDKIQTNEMLARKVIESLGKIGVKTVCFCAGNRSSPFFTQLKNHENMELLNWFEERSAAFFAMGRSRKTDSPVVVITTSGTAAGELLPAVMESYYSGVPLIVVTSDRPRKLRRSGAPQTAEQEHLFGVFTPYSWDVEAGDDFDLSSWDQKTPLHLNIRFEEPFPRHAAVLENKMQPPILLLEEFVADTEQPMVVVGAIPAAQKQKVSRFLQQLKAPVYLEAISGLRDDPDLQPLRIRRSDKILEAAKSSGYHIDGILRIGGMPTFGLWRDLEEMQGKIHVLSLSHLPFSGSSWAHLQIDVDYAALERVEPAPVRGAFNWLKKEELFEARLLQLIHEEPRSEPALIYHLSKLIPEGSLVYLGNSLPIREWDLCATSTSKKQELYASRGLNGIDGQISTFFGLCDPDKSNWAILGDLTTLYDLSAPWIAPQIESSFHIVVVNNSGGRIFANWIPDDAFMNCHTLTFKPFAELWGLSYEYWESVPQSYTGHEPKLIEIVPDNDSSERFRRKLKAWNE